LGAWPRTNELNKAYVGGEKPSEGTNENLPKARKQQEEKRKGREGEEAAGGGEEKQEEENAKKEQRTAGAE
jgi:hypothetical protein